MADQGLHTAVHWLRQFAGPTEAGALADGVLLRRFIEQRDEAAFAALVQRHGPLVFGVCQRVMHNRADSEDVFQATFLVLVRKARSIVKQQSLGSWLHGVAYRIAVRAKGDAARRRAWEAQAERPTASDPMVDLVWRDLRPILDEEVARLPDKFRTSLILCYLEGRTTEEAADLLGCPQGTVLSRLARARELLRGRLARRGVCLSGSALAALLPQHASGVVPAALVDSATTAALRGVAAAVASEALAQGELQAMLISKVRIAGAWFLGACLIVSGGVMLAQPAPGGPGGDPKAPQNPPPAKAVAGAPQQIAWGEPVAGVRLGILGLAPHPTGKDKLQLSVMIENVGKNDVVLNLGIMLANGKRQLPYAIRLAFTDVDNNAAVGQPKTRIFERKGVGIAGRVDPFFVPLPAGCRYTLPCALEDYYDVDVAQIDVPLNPSRHMARAEFIGKGVTRAETNADTPGLALMNYWTGTVRSGEVMIRVAAK